MKKSVIKEELQTIIEVGLDFKESLPISKKSVFGSEIWDWDDESNPRLKGYCISQIKINWSSLIERHDLTFQMIEDLKKYAFLRLNYSTFVFPKSQKNAHPATIVNEVTAAARFFSHLRKELSVGDQSVINHLSDIEVQDLRFCLATYPVHTSTLMAVLTNFGSRVFNKNLGSGSLKWNPEDISTLPWREGRRAPYERIPDKLFCLLSKNATADVKQFLEAFGIELHDRTEKEYEANRFLQAFPDFATIFDRFINYANASDHKNGKFYYEKLVRNMDESIDAKELLDLIDRARIAAQIIIMMYTGARKSELVAFKVNCLHQKEDIWVMVGTVVKGQNISAAVEKDEWVAVPIVRDAVRVLEQTAKINNSKLLFQELYTLNNSIFSITSTVISNNIKLYIGLIDDKKEWENVNIHAHRFRNSLIFEMRKAGLGLPFITYQLKHAYNSLNYSINNSSIEYGGIKSTAVEKAIDDANLMALREIYHPDSPIAGGGAEIIKERRAAYFQGMVHLGMTIDDILLHLAREGAMPLTDVGLAYCQGKTKIMKDGIKTDPPCIGSLRCNPVSCSNAVVTKHKLPMWKRALSENNKRIQDPAFAYAHHELLGAAEEIKSVIDSFHTKEHQND